MNQNPDKPITLGVGSQLLNEQTGTMSPEPNTLHCGWPPARDPAGPFSGAGVSGPSRRVFLVVFTHD